MPEYIEIFQPETEAESAVVRSFLRAEGIESYAPPQTRERPHGTREQNQRLGGLWVETGKAGLAREIISAYLKEVPLTKDEWKAEPMESGSFLQKIRNLIGRILNGP